MKTQDSKSKENIQKFEEKRFFSKISKTIDKYGMIAAGDRILVGISGGKDSLALLKSLAWKKTASRISFDIIAVYIDILKIPYQANIDYISQLCQSHGVEFIHQQINDDVDLSGKVKPPCFVCSWDRRKHLFALSTSLSVNKLALGHHLDDAVETLLMNMMYQSNISSIPPKLSMFNNTLEVIRPLIETPEKEILRFVETQDFKLMLKTCPFEKVSSRQFVREILSQMETKYDRAKINILKSMDHISSEYLVQSPIILESSQKQSNIDDVEQ